VFCHCSKSLAEFTVEADISLPGPVLGFADGNNMNAPMILECRFDAALVKMWWYHGNRSWNTVEQGRWYIRNCMLSLLQCQCMFCPVSAYQQADSPGWCTGVSYWEGLDQMAAHSKSRLNLQIFFLQDPLICLVLYSSQSSMSTWRSNQQGLQFHINDPCGQLPALISAARL
jgi:hypothetical protein